MSYEARPFSVEYKPAALTGDMVGGICTGILATGFACSFYQLHFQSAKSVFLLAASPTLAFGGFAMAYGARRILLGKRPALLVNDAGITHYHVLRDDIHIPWGRISGFHIAAESVHQKQTMPVLEVLDNSPTQKKLISLNTNALDYPAQELVLQLEAYARSRKAMHGGYDSMTNDFSFASLFAYKNIVIAGFVFFALLGIALCLKWFRIL